MLAINTATVVIIVIYFSSSIKSKMTLALFLEEEGHLVSVVNPKLVKKHGEATMQHNKTDLQDASTAKLIELPPT